jgi:hypothetical protein
VISRDVVWLAIVLASFTLLVTAHVWIVIGLLRRRPRWRAPLALVLAPLAPYWAIRERMRLRGATWLAAALAYAVARAAVG